MALLRSYQITAFYDFHIRKKRSAQIYGELVNDNLYWYPDAKMAFNKQGFPEWQAMGFDTRSLYADPLFTDPENGDFSMPIDSPAWDIGFQPIDMSTVGLRHELKWQPPSR